MGSGRVNSHDGRAERMLTRDAKHRTTHLPCLVVDLVHVLPRGVARRRAQQRRVGCEHRRGTGLRYNRVHRQGTEGPHDERDGAHARRRRVARVARRVDVERVVRADGEQVAAATSGRVVLVQVDRRRHEADVGEDVRVADVVRK